MTARKLTQAAVRPLANGKKAVKVVNSAGNIVYAILDADDRPCETACQSLEEPMQRYPLN